MVGKTNVLVGIRFGSVCVRFQVLRRTLIGYSDAQGQHKGPRICLSYPFVPIRSIFADVVIFTFFPLLHAVRTELFLTLSRSKKNKQYFKKLSKISN